MFPISLPLLLLLLFFFLLFFLLFFQFCGTQGFRPNGIGLRVSGEGFLEGKGFGWKDLIRGRVQIREKEFEGN